MNERPAAAVVVRPARPGEAGLVLGFIRELAAFERLAHEAAATEADIAGALFGSDPVCACEIVEMEGEPVGFALWFRTFSTFTGRPGMHLEDLYVRPEARGVGAGRALLRALARRCVQEGWARLEWAVLDWNAPAIGFYDALGAGALDDWTTRRLSGEALAAMARGEPAAGRVSSAARNGETDEKD